VQRSSTMSLFISVEVLVDPHWFLCGSGLGPSFLPQCVSRSESREPNQCGSIRIRILVRLRLVQYKSAFGKQLLLIRNCTCPIPPYFCDKFFYFISKLISLRFAGEYTIVFYEHLVTILIF
jgi:hypothetical protein